MENSSMIGCRGGPRKMIVQVIKRDLELNSLLLNIIHDRALSRFLNHVAAFPVLVLGDSMYTYNLRSWKSSLVLNMS